MFRKAPREGPRECVLRLAREDVSSPPPPPPPTLGPWPVMLLSCADRRKMEADERRIVSSGVAEDRFRARTVASPLEGWTLEDSPSMLSVLNWLGCAPSTCCDAILYAAISNGSDAHSVCKARAEGKRSIAWKQSLLRHGFQADSKRGAMEATFRRHRFAVTSKRSKPLDRAWLTCRARLVRPTILQRVESDRWWNVY